VVLVDLQPEELLVRLREGKVYLGEHAERAAKGFFRRGNLLALRELALRRTAERVDVDVQAYRREHRIAESWPIAEQVLVCVGAAPASARLVRAACRIATGLRAPWVAAWVERPETTPLSEQDRAQLEENLRLAETLGASVVRLVGARPSDAILTWARENSISRIVIGKPTHSRWRDLLRGSLLDAVVRGSGPIDVHVILGDDAPAPLRRAPRAAEPVSWAGALVAAPFVAVATGLAASAWRLLALPDVAMLYLLVIAVAAVRWGRRASIVAAALSVAAYDFFFVEPYYTFAVSDLRHVLTFATMFVIGVVIGTLALRIRRQERAAVQREQRTAVLLALSRELERALDEGSVATALVKAVRSVFGRGAAVLLADPERGLVPAAREGEVALDAPELAVARYAQERDEAAGAGTDTLPGARVRCEPLRSGPDSFGVLVIDAGAAERALAPEDRDLIEAFARQGALVLARSRLLELAKAAAVRARTEELRSSLLSSVSHDLRTPLAAITGAASALREEAAAGSEHGELLDTIAQEAGRLERLLANLLDMTRLESGGVEPKREWVPLEEIVGAALTRLEPQLAGREIRTELPADLPLAFADPVLLEQLVLNLLENAAKHTPPGTPIEVRAAAAEGSLELEVADRGPGLAPGEETKIFEKFQRGARTGAGGVGLGLAICRAIATAHAGRIDAENRPGGGAVFRLVLPLIEGAPGAEPEEGAE
jgi:two-component system sensor histidine kinase KdpD